MAKFVARMVEPVYTGDLKSPDFGHAGSNPASGTNKKGRKLSKKAVVKALTLFAEKGWKVSGV